MSQQSRQYTLSDLSARFELELRGDGEHRIGGVGTLANAGSGDITFLANPGYRRQLGSTAAGAVILQEKDAADCPTNCLVAADPYLAYARIATLFDPRPAVRPGIHPTAVIAQSVRLGRDVSIGAHAVIAEGCVIGDGCAIGPGCVIEADCTLGAGCRLYANVSIGYAVRIGERVIIHPGAVIGADGFGIAFAGDHWEKVPQVGSVVIGNDCEIGANSCIDRGALGDTVLEDDCRLDNLVQIGHNVFVGAHTAIAAMGGAAGSARIGRFCLLGGQAAVTGHQELADRTTLAATSKVMKTVKEPGLTLSGLIPAQPIREWQRSLARLRRLDDLVRWVQNLEEQLGNQSDDDQ
jgi:UDP-3-O-[3-hydroxymyristoyl] glucosamine N-acyltransferase